MGTFREWVECFWLEKDRQVWLNEIDYLEPYFRACPQNHETLSNLLIRVNNLRWCRELPSTAVAESAGVAELFTQMKTAIVGDHFGMEPYYCTTTNTTTIATTTTVTIITTTTTTTTTTVTTTTHSE